MTSIGVTTKSIKLLCNINLLLCRWIEIEMHNETIRGLILQFPWWDLKTAMLKGYFLKFY